MDKVLYQMAVPADTNILISQLKALLQGCAKSLKYRLDGDYPLLQDHISAVDCNNMEYQVLAASLLALFVTFWELVVFC